MSEQNPGCSQHMCPGYLHCALLISHSVQLQGHIHYLQLLASCCLESLPLSFSFHVPSRLRHFSASPAGAACLGWGLVHLSPSSQCAGEHRRCASQTRLSPIWLLQAPGDRNHLSSVCAQQHPKLHAQQNFVERGMTKAIEGVRHIVVLIENFLFGSKKLIFDKRIVCVSFLH